MRALPLPIKNIQKNGDKISAFLVNLFLPVRYNTTVTENGTKNLFSCVCAVKVLQIVKKRFVRRIIS